MGDVIGDINSRRGMISELLDKRGNVKLVRARVPLSEMFQYAAAPTAASSAPRSPFAPRSRPSHAPRSPRPLTQTPIIYFNFSSCRYVSSLRSLTKGRASYAMEVDSYEQVPAAIEKELAAKFILGEDDE